MVYTRSKAHQIERLKKNASHRHYTTPEKACLRGEVEHETARRRQYGFETAHSNTAIFKRNRVPRSSAYRILKSYKDDRRISDQETRGRKPLIPPTKLAALDTLVESMDYEDRTISWDGLAYEADIDCSPRTIKKAMETMDYHKCIACRKAWVSTQLAAKRVEYAKKMLSKYPTPEHWKHVRFSDEVHIGLGPQGKNLIIRKRGQRYCLNCIQRVSDPDEADKRKVHAWAAVGYNFKGPLVFYNIPPNNTGKMSQEVYLNEILKPIVRPWIANHEYFVLEEDQDSGHAPPRSTKTKPSAVSQWKKDVGLQSYFNCAGSPDLAIIEDCFQPLKQYIRKFRHWEPDETRQLAQETWYETLDQEWINKRILTMPDRLRKVIESEGQLIAFGGGMAGPRPG
ncbi:hypothetical protein P152DRAFT_461448 [Eremomyces bilateralis CBS 781.70]|uniref:Tc1-like transposase DDE domain-containing protein n=1 Tax=Eremomyces bilateralis CBS 781.70 TaxID=1392243 RepID=A0A6G1FUS0_9PEZI|nr:uncharacterized protein P152DRAFT_461448 [Eremomyces bilateralis CBS 781.70]KAF1809503.1 hypothetical protein P152DRAFT_461448 [Eremomyces bilateralis CBS 781.70]